MAIQFPPKLPNLSGASNTGDVTIGTVNGLSLSGQALSLATAVAGGANRCIAWNRRLSWNHAC
jgi:hypothetical protein